MMSIRKLSELVEKARNENQRSGQFGIDACRESIEWSMDFEKKSAKELYPTFISRAICDVFFNVNMIIACEELIKEEIARRKEGK